MTFKIVDNMEMPRKVNGTTKYGFGRMSVGQCMVFDPNPAERDYFLTVRNAAYAWGKKNGAKFSARTLPDGRFGIWRVE